jgi:hypothetical protein
MPKPVKKSRKPPRDVNQWARHLVEQSTGETEPEAAPPIPPAALSAYMSALGRKGGQKGGKRRLETMTAEERSAVALKAARSRWKKAKAAKRG